MQLKEFSFREKNTGWNLSTSKFDTLTLLVGASGVGKTKILESIETLKRIAIGDSYNGIVWNALFYDKQIGLIRWEGSTEQSKISFDQRQIPFTFPELESDEDKPEFNFEFEKMTINDEEVFIRDQSSSSYRGNKTVKLKQGKSLLNLLQEDDVSQVKNIFEKNFNRNGVLYHALSTNTLKSFEKFSSFDEVIKDTTASTTTKFFVAYSKYPDIFKTIKNDFIEIFPFVEDLRFGSPDALTTAKHNPAPDLRILQLKERDSKNWVCVWDFSSGMHKTLSLLASIYLSAQNSIFLIDEFENSFGVNCIDMITQKIALNPLGNQFILSSHHPYIINSIPVNKWRLVTRKKTNVNVVSVEDKITSKSKHDAFIQLINLDEFSDGIEI